MPSQIDRHSREGGNLGQSLKKLFRMLNPEIPAFAGMTLVVVSVLISLLPLAAYAQSLNLDMGGGGSSATARVVQLVILMTILSLAPSILIMVTSFMRIMIVLSFVRTAMGTQNTPPNQVLVALALFLTI